MRQLLRYFCGPHVLRNPSNIDPPNLFDRFAAQPGEVAICATLVRRHTDVYFCTILDPLAGFSDKYKNSVVLLFYAAEPVHKLRCFTWLGPLILLNRSVFLISHLHSEVLPFTRAYIKGSNLRARNEHKRHGYLLMAS